VRPKPVLVDAPPRDGIHAPEPGWHHAVCCEVRDYGWRQGRYGLKPWVEFVFQLEARNPTSGRRWILSARFVKSLHRLGRLRRALETWRARALSEAELEAGVVLSVWEGAPARVHLVHLPPRHGYATPLIVIDEIVPIPAGIVITPEDYARRWKVRGTVPPP
jgi:hypothetical protein